MKLTPLGAEPQLRIDTTVGTRVFAGTTMIAGDTGTRVVNDVAIGFDFSNSSLHRMTLRRVGDQVFLEATGVRTVEDVWFTNTLPGGFRPRSGEYNAMRGTVLRKGNLIPIGNSNTLVRLTITGELVPVGDTVMVNASWLTNDGWPTTLPGTPT